MSISLDRGRGEQGREGFLGKMMFSRKTMNRRIQCFLEFMSDLVVLASRCYCLLSEPAMSIPTWEICCVTTPTLWYPCTSEPIISCACPAKSLYERIWWTSVEVILLYSLIYCFGVNNLEQKIMR